MKALKNSQNVLKSLKKPYKSRDYLEASSIATATATVIPTMGLLATTDNRRRTSLRAACIVQEIN